MGVSCWCSYERLRHGSKKKESIVFHEDKLIAALNKYWRPIGRKELKEDMDVQDIHNAIQFSGMPKDVVDKIWEKRRGAFEVY